MTQKSFKKVQDDGKVLQKSADEGSKVETDEIFIDEEERIRGVFEMTKTENRFWMIFVAGIIFAYGLFRFTNELDKTILDIQTGNSTLWVFAPPLLILIGILILWYAIRRY